MNSVVQAMFLKKDIESVFDVCKRSLHVCKRYWFVVEKIMQLGSVDLQKGRILTMVKIWVSLLPNDF